MGEPHLGLVCITRGDAVHFRTSTRTRYLALDTNPRFELLSGIYRDNLRVLFGALDFCADNGIHLYRMSANLFPLSDLDDGIGRAVLDELSEEMAAFGPRAEALGIRVVVHPEQFVVLNSERPQVVANSVAMLEHQGFVFDRFGLPRSRWAAMNIHGGKGGRADQLVEIVADLAEGVRSRLTFENDERAYGAEAILEICERAGVPMVFDAHHHVVKEKLAGFDHESVERFTRLARRTWQPPDWQIVHLSNGREGPQDSRHSDLIREVPSAYAQVGWIEVEAKAKEEAIARLRRDRLL